MAVGSPRKLVTLLTPADDELPIGVATDAGLAEAATRLANVLRMTVRDQGDWAHGYPTFHGRAQGSGSVAQFWLSPNEVSRGFVRKDDRDYATLVNLLPGTALRIPEHPDCTLILSGSELGNDELLAACARAGLRARQLDAG